MAVLGIITKRNKGLLLLGGAAMLFFLSYVKFKEANHMAVDAESIARREVNDYAKRQNLMPSLFKLAGRENGPDGRQLFDYEYDAPLKHSLRIDVSRDGSVEVSRMID